MTLRAVIAKTVSLASLRKRAKKGHKGKILSPITKSVNQEETPKGEGFILLNINDDIESENVLPKDSNLTNPLNCENNKKNLSFQDSYVTNTLLKESNFHHSPLNCEFKIKNLLFDDLSFPKPSLNLNKNFDGNPKENASRWHLLIEQIQDKVSELEKTIYEDQQREFKLKMALERQTERVNDLRFSLDTEKQRNKRLVELIRADENSQNSENECEELNKDLKSRSTMSWQTPMNSISPLLMQQRYDELSDSYKKVSHQLAKKKKLLILEKCKHEELQAKFDYLYDSYRTEQKSFAEVCGKYFMLEFKKNQEVLCFRTCLSYAADCIINARHMLDDCEKIDKNLDKEFEQNLEYFITSLRHCNAKQKPPLSNFI